ncbi:NAD-dependent histone deacetylase [Aureococcus anophagefferens]|nr:NAD-dependent histone deacetylase [Aureococcus anophagefferens]
MAGDEAKPADEAPDDAEAPPQPAQPQTQSLYPKFMYDSRDTPEGEQEKTLPPDELRKLALPRVLGGGVRRVAGETYPNALLTDGWPSDGLLLARSAVAERILVDRYGADRGAVGRDHPQWWPARAISIEEYLEYYATTLAKHRPKFDHVAVVFLRPWWSEHLADDGVARMFELEPAPAKATHVRPLAGSDPAPPSTPAPAADVAAGRFRDALRIAGALSGYAASHLGASSEPRDGPRDAEGWERRRARLAEAYGNSSASPRDKKRDPPRDVSTAHVDVVNYPSVVLTLPWYEIVTKTPGDLVLADLPRSLVGADLDAGRPRGLGRSSISPLDGPPEKRPVAAEFGNMGRERSNSVRSIGSPRNSLGGGSPSPSASAAKKGVASPPKAPREPPTARERADVAALLGGPISDFGERAFRDAVRRDGAPAEAEALPPSVFRPASPTLEALPAADVTEEDSEARSSKASSESPPASPKDNPEVARAAESKDGGEEDSGGEAPMERDDDDAPPAADDDAAMDDADAAPAAAEEDDEEAAAAAAAPAAMDVDGDDDERSAKRPKTARGVASSSGDAISEEAEAAAEDDDDEEAAEAPPPATAAGGPRCDKCDGAHETADCPYFKKEREPSPVQNMKPVQPLSSAGLLKRRASDRSLSGQMPPASPRERPPAGKPGSPRSRSRKPPSPHASRRGARVGQGVAAGAGQRRPGRAGARGRPRSNTPAGEAPRRRRPAAAAARTATRLAALDRGDSPPPPPPPPVRPAALDQPAAPSQPKPPAHGPFSEGSDHLGDDAHNRLFDAAAFDRASRRDCPSLAPPEDAPVDGSRPLVYLGAGDDVEDCGDRCHKASSQTKRALLAKHGGPARGGPAAGSSARHVAPELWLYLARAARTGRGLREAGPGLRPRGAQAQEARSGGASDDDGGGGSSGDDDASPRSDEGADDRDLRRARRERVAVLEVLEKVDRCVQQLVNKDDAALRDACAAAATAHNDAELILTKVVAAQAAGVGRAASSAASRGPRPGPARAEEAPEPLRRRGDGGARGGQRDADADLPAYEWAGARRPRTLAIYDRRCRLHETKVYCMEQSRRAVAAAAVVEAAALRHPTRLWVERSVHEGYLGRATALLSYAHSRVYVSAVRRRRCLDLKTNATMLFGGEDEDTCGNRHTWDASLAASAAVLQAVDAVVSGEAKNALCAVRPPGHHAGASVNALGAESNGYCILNHAALGAKYAAHERGLQRVAVFDFDVHHGNGTEDVLARTCDPRFMYLSLHACGRDVYPGSGKREVPDHPGVLNLPHAYEEPMTAECSGFDAHKRDPVDLGRFDASDYGDLTRACVDWARRNCCGRVVSVLEGGYGVDCGPAGEYVQSGRREAFDTCLRAHVDELIADDAADTADDPEPANPQTARVSAPHLEAAAADRRGKAAAFFQEPPPDQ